MIKALRPRLTYANVMATIAVFLVLGGGAYAAGKLEKNSVGAKQIRDGAITGSKVAPNSLTGTQVNETTLDPAVVQDRVAGTCGGGQAVASVGQDGSVGCHATGAGATDIAFGGGGTPPASPLTSVDAASTTVTVSGSGKVLAFGMPTTDYIPSCGGVGCQLALGLYLDGIPIPGSREARSAAAGAPLGTYAPVQGLATGVSPGTHTVTLKLAEEVNGFVAPVAGSATVSAIAPGA